MANEFKEFVEFVRQATGREPKFADSLKELFIYVPSGKTPPEAEDPTSTFRRTISIKNYINNRNKDFVDCVYNEDWNRLEDHLGSRLLRFCLTECILAKRTKTGAFMVSKFSNLRNKIPAVEPPPKIGIAYRRVAEEKLSVVESYGSETVGNLNRLLGSTDLKVTTDHMLHHTFKSRKLPPRHTPMWQTPVSSQVINHLGGNWKLVEFEDCIQPLELILNKFRKNHKRYAYAMALDKLIISESTRSGGTACSFEHQIPVVVLKKYFGDIMSVVVPKELFGSNRNRNAVIKSICGLLDAPRGQAVGLGAYILKMKVSDIRWMDGVENTDTQWSLMAKLVKWLHDKFILQLLMSQLYITVTDSNKKVYFKQTDWRKVTTQFLRQMRDQGIIARSDGVVTRLCSEGRWMLFPKKNGVRPIMTAMSEPRETTKIALSYLQQLYVTKYGASGKKLFLEKWRNLMDARNDNKTLYLVCCDIQYAYESIDQKKLSAIVESLAALTGSELCRKWYRVGENLKAVKSDSTELKQYFAYPELELPVASKSIFACTDEKVVKISKEVMLREIRRNILNQNVHVSGQRYLLQKGIAQGAMLSSVLCDIYYANMEETSLSEYKEQGFLYRYVDDYLFVTEDKTLAERFLQHVDAGFPEYNCSFNTAKTRTNLQPRKDSIPFLGFNIDPNTFEVTLSYSNSSRYTTMLSEPISQTMTRLSNLATLKLDGIVLDRKINSKGTIIHNVKCAFTRQAERCLWLLKALFDDIPSQLRKIFQIMKSTNLQIIQRIQRYFLANGYNFDELIPLLWTISWRSYRQVFGKEQHIHAHFRKLFLEHMKVNEEPMAKQPVSSKTLSTP